MGNRERQRPTSEATWAAVRLLAVGGLVTALVAGLGWKLGMAMKMRQNLEDLSARAAIHSLTDEPARPENEDSTEFAKRLQTIPVDYFPALLDAIDTLPEDNRFPLARLVWQTWGRRDPLTVMDDPNVRANWAARALLDGWAERDFDAAWKAAREFGFGEQWKRKAIGALAESDPIRGAKLIERYVSEIPGRLSNYRWLRKPLTAIARTVPDEAFRLARSCDNSAARGGAGLELEIRIELEMLTQEAAVAIVLSNPNILHYVFSSLRKAGDYDVATSAAERLLAEFKANKDLLSFVDRLQGEIQTVQSEAEKAEQIEFAMQDPESALSDATRRDRRAIARRWLEEAPVAARASLLHRTAAGEDLADVIFKDAHAFTDAELWTTAVTHLSEAESYLEHDRMLQLARSIPAAGEHLHSLEAVTRTWSSDDRAGALQWIESQAQEFHDPLWFQYLLKNDPDGTAMTTFLEQHPASDYHVRALPSGSNDPFATGHSHDKQAQQVIANAREWLTNLQPDEQESWLQSKIEEGDEVEQLATAFPKEMLRQLPPPGDGSDGDWASDRFHNIVSAWAKTDPAAAAAYLIDSPPPVTTGALSATISVFLGNEVRLDEALTFAAKYPTEDRFTLMQFWVENASVSAVDDPFADDLQDSAKYLSDLTQLIDGSGLDSRQLGDLWQALDRRLLSN